MQVTRREVFVVCNGNFMQEVRKIMGKKLSGAAARTGDVKSLQKKKVRYYENNGKSDKRPQTNGTENRELLYRMISRGQGD